MMMWSDYEASLSRETYDLLLTAITRTSLLGSCAVRLKIGRRARVSR